MPRAGRPPRSEPEATAARQALLAATLELLSTKPSQSISIREIAGRAGVNSALISYHFGGKEGLIAALIDSAAKPLLTLDMSMLKLLPPSQRTKIVVSRFATIHQSNRWLPRLLVDDLLGDNTPLRERFIEQVGGKLAKLLNGFVRLQQSDGYFRADLDTRQTGVALLSLLAFPFVATALLERSHRLRPTQQASEKWIDQLCRMFEGGCRR
jgi:AcrR family transcriptional regulator